MRKALDARTLRTLGRRFRKDAKGPRRNYDAINRPRNARPDFRSDAFRNGESKGYWRGWFCALQQLADELLEEARLAERKAKKGTVGK